VAQPTPIAIESTHEAGIRPGVGAIPVTPTARVDASAQQAEVFDPFDDLLDGGSRVLGLFPAGDDDFPAAEQQDDDPRLVHPVDEARELFGFVLDVFESEADRQRVEIEVVTQIGARNDVLDRDF
jgi:hypothetical protein